MPGLPNSVLRAASRRARRLVPPLACALALCTGDAAAQRRAAAFETLDLAVALLADVHQGALQRDWSPGPGLELTAALPFYAGVFEGGIQYAHPSSRRGDVPGFRSLFFYIGWGGAQALGGGFRADARLRAGIVALRFDGDTIPGFRRRESEPGIAARGALRWMPRDPWFAEAAAAWQLALTEPHMQQLFLSAGLGRRFRTPSWLRDFLD